METKTQTPPDAEIVDEVAPEEPQTRLLYRRVELLSAMMLALTLFAGLAILFSSPIR